MRARSNGYCALRGMPAGCFQAKLTRDKNVAYDQWFHDFYAGDTILLGNLTVQAGLRWDRQKTANLATSAAANPILSQPLTLPCVPAGGNAGQFCGSSGTFTTSIPAISFAGDPRDLKWNSVSPRVGLTYTLGADKKTLLRAGYNRYVDQIGPTISLANPVGYTYAYAMGIDSNNDQVIQRNELMKWQNFYYYDPTNPAALVSTTRIDYGMKPQRSDEFIAGFERELFTDFSVGLNGTYRRINNVTGRLYEKHQGQGDFYTGADYVQVGTTPTTYVNDEKTGFTLTLPSVPVYDLKPGIDAPVYSVVTNLPGYSRTYKGLEFVATKRLSNRWMMRGNVSWNDWTEDCSLGSTTFPNPTPAYGNCPGGQFTQRSAGSGSFGNVFISSRWSYNVTGLYQLPWDFNLGASLTGRQGYPAPYNVGSADLGLAGSTNVATLARPIGDMRFDNVYELDLRAAKDFRFFNRVGVTLSADLFNVPNQRTVLQRNTTITPIDFGPNGPNSACTATTPAGAVCATQLGNIRELQSPRVWRFGARINF
jgi:hypothetical protein